MLGIVPICRSCSKTPDASDFDGTYYIDDYTAYEFDGKGNGAMCLDGTTRYVFDYAASSEHTGERERICITCTTQYGNDYAVQFIDDYYI